MIKIRTNLNLVPGRIPPRIKVNQMDADVNALEFAIYNGPALFEIPSGATVTIQGEKPDHKGFQYAATGSGNVVTANLTEQMTAVAGEVITELSIMDAQGNRVATANFVIVVEPSALGDSAISESELPLIEAAARNVGLIEELAKQTESNAKTAASAKDTAVSKAAEATASASNAAGSATSAAASATNAGQSATSAEQSASTASASAKVASTAADTATTQTNKSQSYADDARYYYEQTQALSPDYEGIVATTQTAPLTLSNSKAGAFNLTQIDGKMEQETTTGKNLLPMTVESIKALNIAGTWNGNVYAYHGLTITIMTEDSNNVNGISISGNLDTTYIILTLTSLPLLSGTYILNGCPSGAGDYKYKLKVGNDINDNGSGVAFNADGLSGANVSIVLYANVGTYSDLAFYPMIRRAAITDPTYEPYTGGIPSPNPDFPQEIRKVTVDKVKVTGKNLFDESILSDAISSVKYVHIYVGSGIFTVSTTTPLTRTNSANLFFLPGKAMDGASTGQNGVSNSLPKTVSSIDGYVTIGYRNYENINPAQYTTQLELGSTATAYEPYHSQTITLLDPIDLYGTDDVKDRLYRDADGLVKVERKYGKVVLDGSKDEGWSVGKNLAQNATLLCNLPKGIFVPQNNATVANIMSSQFIAKTADSIYYSQQGISINVVTRACNIYDANFSGELSDWISYLEFTPMEVVYELAEYTTEVLPTAEQIALNSIPTYNTVTYLELLDTEVEPEISGEYGISKVGGYTLAAKQHEAITKAMYTVENGVLCAFVDYE